MNSSVHRVDGVDGRGKKSDPSNIARRAVHIGAELLGVGPDCSDFHPVFGKRAGLVDT